MLGRNAGGNGLSGGSQLLVRSRAKKPYYLKFDVVVNAEEKGHRVTLNTASIYSAMDSGLEDIVCAKICKYT